MTFQESFATGIKKYADFSGRATRSEYWWFVLAVFLIYIIATMVSDILLGVAALILLLPHWAVGVRRMHDIGKSGWWLLLSIIPIIGLIVLYWLVQPSEPVDNMYGNAS